MKRLLIVVVVLFLVVKLVRVVRREIEDRAIRRELAGTMKRQAGYESSLLRYTDRFKLGMTREEVESALRADKIKFSSPNNPSEDLVELGAEYISHIGGLRFCGWKIVYVAFQFGAQEQGNHVTRTVLEHVWLDHRMLWCL